MILKRVFIIPLVILLFASTGFAATSCQDAKVIADKKIKERNAQVKANYNAVMLDPAEDRDSLLSCLDSINALGNMFTMNVHIPSLQSLLNKVCNKADLAIQSKINAAMVQLEQKATEDLGGFNPFHVNIDGDRIVDDLVGNIR